MNFKERFKNKISYLGLHGPIKNENKNITGSRT